MTSKLRVGDRVRVLPAGEDFSQGEYPTYKVGDEGSVVLDTVSVKAVNEIPEELAVQLDRFEDGDIVYFMPDELERV